MVYCGKASQGCQSCRTRRIKCDRALPQCTQCLRVRKTCPGYRDQLSLMFRDESTKVIRRAHAQWGVTESPEPGESSASPHSTSPSEAATPPSASLAPKHPRIADRKRVPKEICATPVDKAIQFYVEHYVLGLPDEPRVGQELRGSKWLYSRETRDIMAAVGLAGLSNLTGDKDMNMLAKHHYGLALQNVSSSIQNVAALDLDIIMRAVVMMAMYEVVRGRDEAVSPARTHVMGGAALLSSALPLYKSPQEGTRGLLQLCFSMVAAMQSSSQLSSAQPNVLIPTHTGALASDGALPEPFFDWVSMSGRMVSEPDKPSAELISVIARFVQLSAHVRSQVLVDGQPKTADMIRKALEIDEELDSWERRQKGAWTVVEERVDDLFPGQAVFDGCYHVYADMYIARVWNHYRWARTMVNQMLLESIDRFPVASAPLLMPKQQKQLSLDRIQRLARDTLVSTPSHYRHPSLQPAHCDYFDRTKGGAGIGIAGIPTLLFEVNIAGCAPGIPYRYRTWALGMLETIWADTGMFQARALANLLQKVVELDSPNLSPGSVGEEVAGHEITPAVAIKLET